MNLLLEGIFFNFKYITGIERNFFLQLEIFEKCQLFNKIYIVVKHEIPSHLLDINLDLEIIRIFHNSVEEWKNIYRNLEFDFVYSTFVPPPILPPNHVPLLYILHDPGRYIYPELMEENTLDEHMRLFDQYVKSNQFYVITGSESSKKDILKYFPSLEERIFIIYNFINNTFIMLKKNNHFLFRFPYSLDVFFLTIGRYIPTKNTLSIINAFEKRESGFKDFKLVIIGRKGWYERLNRYLNHYQKNDIVILDYVTDEELFSLYRNSYGFVSASIYEGFGLPLIEAKYCGCQRIFCSDIPVYREINLKDSIYFDPNNPLDLYEKAFKKFIHPSNSVDPRLDLFSLSSVAKQFKETIEYIGGSGS